MVAIVNFNRALWAAARRDSFGGDWTGLEIQEGLVELLKACELFEERMGSDKSFAETLKNARITPLRFFPRIVNWAP